MIKPLFQVKQGITEDNDPFPDPNTMALTTAKQKMMSSNPLGSENVSASKVGKTQNHLEDQ